MTATRGEFGELFRLVESLSAANIDFVICGGVACVLHGVQRATYDLDVCVAMEHDNLRNLLVIMDKLSLIPRIPEPADALMDEERRKHWIEEKNALVFTFVSDSSPLQMDVFLTYPVEYEELKKDAEVLSTGSHQFRISSIPHLLSAKNKVDPMREKDELDIAALERLQGERSN